MESSKQTLNTPIDYVNSVKIVSYTYHIANIQLFNSIHVNICLYGENSDSIPVRCISYIIEGDEYAAWSNDDNYILELIKNKVLSYTN